MYWQLITGVSVTVFCILVQSFFIGAIVKRLKNREPLITGSFPSVKYSLLLIITMTWLVLGLSLSCGAWTYVYLKVGAFDQVEPALYFSMVSFTTLGFGDITLGKDYRLLSGLTAVSGLIVFGLTTAFIVDLMSSLRKTRNF